MEIHTIGIDLAKTIFHLVGVNARGVGPPSMRFVPIKTDDQLDLQSLHRVRERWVGRRTAVIYTSTPPRGLGGGQRLLESARHKVEGGSPFHHQRFTVVMRENDGRCVVRRIVTTPALP